MRSWKNNRQEITSHAQLAAILLVAATNMPDGGRIEYWFEPKIYMTEQQRNYLEVVGCGVNRGNFTTI